MPYYVTARFSDVRSARTAAQSLHLASATLGAGTLPVSVRENRFMGRIVLMIIAWSIVGTALGAALGALIAVLFGPSGTEGMIIQAVSWAIFAHLLIGMWAGYLLLADRSGADLPAVREDRPVALHLQCANIDETRGLADRLRSLGALTVDTEETGEYLPQYQI